jgi:hypothetical protein
VCYKCITYELLVNDLYMFLNWSRISHPKFNIRQGTRRRMKCMTGFLQCSSREIRAEANTSPSPHKIVVLKDATTICHSILGYYPLTSLQRQKAEDCQPFYGMALVERLALDPALELRYVHPVGKTVLSSIWPFNSCGLESLSGVAMGLLVPIAYCRMHRGMSLYKQLLGVYVA